MEGAKAFAVAVGVGHDEDPVPVVGKAQVSGGQA